MQSVLFGEGQRASIGVGVNEGCGCVAATGDGEVMIRIRQVPVVSRCPGVTALSDATRSEYDDVAAATPTIPFENS